MNDQERIRARIDFEPFADTGLDEAKPRFAEVPWPDGTAPTPASTKAYQDTDPLPAADVLIVTYTVAEGHALADVLTPGVDTTDWVKYRNNWAAIKSQVAHGAPSLATDCAALWSLTEIGGKRVVVVKSELHPSTDGPKLPMALLWRQMIGQVRPTLVITTGTAGGVGSVVELGDVIVAANVKWNCQKQFREQDFAHIGYGCTPLTESVQEQLNLAEIQLMPVNAGRIPAQYMTRPIHILTGHDVETTDFFAFDDKADHYGLRAYDVACAAVEMDDAALGLALTTITASPAWVSVRNASDPQMDEATLAAEDKLAGQIYERYGYWTTVGSAITCWALVAGLS